MRELLTSGQMLSAQAHLQPNNPGARDLERQMTFLEWNKRACRLANALIGKGLSKGDRVTVLAYNCLEWAEIYMATAKAEIIKIEPPSGDPVRTWGAQIDGNSVWWSVHGRNKKSVVVDLKADDARDIILKIVAKRDQV